MNTLSWLLYAIDLASEVNSLARWTVVVGVVVAGLTVIFGGIGAFIASGEGVDVGSFLRRWTRPVVRTWLIYMAVVLTIGVVTPSERTLYMIAASEIGETAVTSEDGQAVINALRRKVMEYLDVEGGE